MRLTKEILEDVTKRLDAGEEICVWVTGRPIAELPVRRLLEHCRDYQKAGHPCCDCPLGEMCENLEFDQLTHMLEKDNWTAGEKTLLEAIELTCEARRTGDCHAHCPLGDGQPDRDWPCWYCPGYWVKPGLDYWRHTEDELM